MGLKIEGLGDVKERRRDVLDAEEGGGVAEVRSITEAEGGEIAGHMGAAEENEGVAGAGEGVAGAGEGVAGAGENVVGGDNWLDQFVAEQEVEQKKALPRISKLTAGIRDPNRVNVFLDGRFSFSLDVAQVVDFGVKVGQELTPERLTELRDASEFGKLYQRTLEWILARPHSTRETRDYLRRRQIRRRQLNRQREREGSKPLADIKDNTISLVVERLGEKGYLNDEKFAEYFIENRHVRRGISHKRLKLELQQKGVATEIINRLLGEEVRDESEEIAKMIAKKRKKYNDQQLVNYLIRQGFNYQTVREAVENCKVDEK